MTDQQRIANLMAKPINRRGFLSLVGASAAAAGLAACSSGAGTTTRPSSVAPSASGSAAPGSVPPSDAPLPSYEIEDELLTYNWSQYVSDKNIAEFKERFGVENFGYDTFAGNEELITKLQAGATGYDITCPTAEFVAGMAEEGWLQELDQSRIPNLRYINPTFRSTAWDPDNKYIVPKDYGTTGIVYRKKLVSEPVTSWREFYDLSVGKYSGKVVFVNSASDVFPFALKYNGFSVNDNDPAHLEAARQTLLSIAPHLLALDSDLYQEKLASEEAALCLGWGGPLVDYVDDPETADMSYVVPSDGTIFWLDAWVMLADAPHPNAAYAWLNFIHEPEIQAEETIANGYATPNDEAKKHLPKEILEDTLIFPPDDVVSALEGSLDHSGVQQRSDIWAEFVSKVGA